MPTNSLSQGASSGAPDHRRHGDRITASARLSVSSSLSSFHLHRPARARSPAMDRRRACGDCSRATCARERQRSRAAVCWSLTLGYREHRIRISQLDPIRQRFTRASWSVHKSSFVGLPDLVGAARRCSGAQPRGRRHTFRRRAPSLAWSATASISFEMRCPWRPSALRCSRRARRRSRPGEEGSRPRGGLARAQVDAGRRHSVVGDKSAAMAPDSLNRARLCIVLHDFRQRDPLVAVEVHIGEIAAERALRGNASRVR